MYLKQSGNSGFFGRQTTPQGYCNVCGQPTVCGRLGEVELRRYW